MDRTLLIVDDEANILTALMRVFRRDGYRVVQAGSGSEGLERLTEEEIGVVLSDQRMPGMTGVEFLSQVKERWPDTVRIMLSGYTDLKSVTDAINEGAIYRFLTKPWDDEQLRRNVAEAFELYELKAENQRLNAELKEANAQLEAINRHLEQQVEIKTREVVVNMQALQAAQEVLERLPFAVLGISADGIVATANQRAHEALAGVALVGSMVQQCLPSRLLAAWNELVARGGGSALAALYDGTPVRFLCRPMGQAEAGRGWIVVLLTEEALEPGEHRASMD